MPLRAGAQLQDTLGNTLLPRVLEWLAEPVGPAIDKLARAKRLGWVSSAATWIECWPLRNYRIHEYVRDMAALADALTKGHLAVPLLAASAQTLAGLVLSVDAGSNVTDQA